MKNPTPPELKVGDRVRRLTGYRHGKRANEQGEVIAVGGRKWIGSIPVPSVKVKFPSIRVSRWYAVDQLEAVSNEIVEPQ